jgi:membrane fusion protein, heavy metal efflux system
MFFASGGAADAPRHAPWRLGGCWLGKYSAPFVLIAALLGGFAATPTAASPPASPAASAWAELSGDTLEAVIHLRQGRMMIWIDHKDSNTPVTHPKVMASTQGRPPIEAQAQPDGTYVAATPWGVTEPFPPSLALVVTGHVEDLLVGAVQEEVLAPPKTTTEAHDGFWHSLRLAGVAVVFFAGILIGRFAWPRKTGQPASVAARTLTAPCLILFLLTTGAHPTHAHEGHIHGPEEEEAQGPKATPPSKGMDRPARNLDGTLFVPKAVQRLLEVRSFILQPQRAAIRQDVMGRIAIEPGRGGRAQAPRSGRLVSPRDGFPRLGQQVMAGDTLAYIETTLQASDQGDLAASAASLDRRIDLARQALERLERLRDVVAQRQIDEARAELAGLRRERAALRAILDDKAGRVPVRAPVSGVIVASEAIAGRMIEDRDAIALFDIAPREAIAIETVLAPSLSFVPSGAIAGGLPSHPVGTMQWQGAVVAMETSAIAVDQRTGLRRAWLVPADKTALLGPESLGRRIPLSLATGREEAVLLIPAQAMVRDADGMPAVMAQIGPQRFKLRPVRYRPAGAGMAILDAGVEAGDRIVIQGAALLNQIR